MPNFTLLQQKPTLSLHDGVWILQSGDHTFADRNICRVLTHVFYTLNFANNYQLTHDAYQAEAMSVKY